MIYSNGMKMTQKKKYLQPKVATQGAWSLKS